jgi:hypothetical protein
MSGAARGLADFAGAVGVHLMNSGALRLALEGRDWQGRRMSVVFAQPRDVPQMPRQLHDVRVALEAANAVPAGGRGVHITAREGAYLVAVAGIHVHRDLTDELRRVVPPRAAPWRKRVLWRALLALAASTAGRRLLRGIRRN